MTGVEVVLAVNIAVGSLFAAGYAIIAFSNASQRAALWFALSYLIGMVTPVTDFVGGLLGASKITDVVSYIAFLVASLSITASIAIFHQRPLPWRALLAVLAFGLGMRLWIWDMERDTLTYGFAYQSCYVLASLLTARTTWTIERRGPLHVALAALFLVIAVHFALKHFAAVTLGSGSTFADYTKTTYAMISQSTSGMLLVAAGILLLLIVAQKAIAESQHASETDPLSGLTNRRGFDRLADAAMLRAGRGGLPVAAALFDLDHFKRVNDTFGHATGDKVIAGFAAVLRATAPGAAVTARQGGEEFVMLIEGATAETAWLAAEAVRLRAAAGLGSDLPRITVSGGVAELRAGESLADLLRRADQAAYEAKNTGRDRICRAEAAQPDALELRLTG
ncbi:MAG: GGDEF domain-containing protein [Phenylobacterium zucineum]|nr:MAG: GGDEF domain-containing protein [Phenylobacterium zucineum]